MSMINEFVEEIKAKINHKKEYHKNFYEKLGQNLNDNDLHKATQLAFDDCMEFINELAEKYRDVPDTNVGKWIPVSEALPDTEKYILLSFSNFPIPIVGRWEEDENGGAFYIGDEDDSCVSQDLYVNAWQPLPPCWKGE